MWGPLGSSWVSVLMVHTSLWLLYPGFFVNLRSSDFDMGFAFKALGFGLKVAWIYHHPGLVLLEDALRSAKPQLLNS